MAASNRNIKNPVLRAHPEDSRVCIATNRDSFLEAARSGKWGAVIFERDWTKETLRRNWEIAARIWTEHANYPAGLSTPFSGHPYPPEGVESLIAAPYTPQARFVKDLVSLHRETGDCQKHLGVIVAENIREGLHTHSHPLTNITLIRDKTGKSGTAWVNKKGETLAVAEGNPFWFNAGFGHKSADHDFATQGTRYSYVAYGY